MTISLKQSSLLACQYFDVCVKIYRNRVTFAGEPESNTRMLIHMLTGYQRGDLFLPISAYGVSLHLAITQKVQCVTERENKASVLSASCMFV